VALFVVFGIWLQGKFLNVDGRMLDVHQNAPIYVLGLAEMVVLIAGHVDLSVASMAGLVSFVVIELNNHGVPMAWAMIIGLLIGAVGGVLNSVLVVNLRVNAFIATIATSGIYDGVALVSSHGTQVLPEKAPSWFTGVGSLGDFTARIPVWLAWVAYVLVALALARAAQRAVLRRRPRKVAAAASALLVLVVGVVLATVGPVPGVVRTTSWTVAVLLVLSLLVWTLTDLTVTGRNMRAIGSNSDAARLAGVRVERTTLEVFVLAGVLSAVAGILLCANQGVASPGATATFLLPAFAAAFLSTSLFSSGSFNTWGTVIGGVFIVWVAQALIVGGVNFTWTGVVNGLVLALAVAFSSFIRRLVRR